MTLNSHLAYFRYFLYSKISPGWHPNALQAASNVDNRIAFALPFFNMEILAIVMPTFPANSVTLIFRFTNMTSMLMAVQWEEHLAPAQVITYNRESTVFDHAFWLAIEGPAQLRQLQ